MPTAYVSAIRVRPQSHYLKPPRMRSASSRMDAGAFRAGIHHPLELRVIFAAFGGFHCAPSTLR